MTRKPTYKELERKVRDLEKEAIERKRAEEALRWNEERFRSLIESANSWIWQVDQNGIYTYASPKAEALLGYKPEEIVGKTPFDFMPEDEAERAAGLFRDIVQSGKPFSRLENTNINKEGQHVVLETSGVPVLDAYGNVLGYRGIDRDITERKTLKQESKFAYAELNQIFNTISGGIRLIDKNFNVLKANQGILTLCGTGIDGTIGKKCYETFSSDLCKTPECILTKILSGEEHIEMEVEKKCINGKTIPCILSATPFRAHEGELVGIVEHLTDITLRKKYENELNDSLRELRKALRGTIQAMAVTVETRDPYTAGHQQRVSDLSSVMATEMGFSKDKIMGIRMAGVLHDIGKIAIPAEILSKPGRLSESEFGIIKNHPQVGYNILKSIKFPWPLSQIVLQHHERMDGSGYPNGLLGKEMLIESRILGVADVVEAMASHRPYRPALGIDKALEKISINKGKLYDVGVVNACLRVFKDKKFKFKV